MLYGCPMDGAPSVTLDPVWLGRNGGMRLLEMPNVVIPVSGLSSNEPVDVLAAFCPDSPEVLQAGFVGV